VTPPASADESAAVRLAAGVVAFHPDLQRLIDLLAALHPQAARVCLFVNGGMDDDQIAACCAACPSLIVIEAPANLGVGEALNILALDALVWGASHLWVFDQDSSPTADLAPRLQSLMTQVRPIGPPPALMAPRLVAPADEPDYKPPRLQRRPGVADHAQAWPTQYAATSGSLIDLSAFRAIGPFRADFFIDGIDLEWGLRAWARGYSVWIAKDAVMAHRIGAGVERLAGGLTTPAQSPMRLASYARNVAAMLRLAHPPLGWKLRQGGYLFVQMILLWARRGFAPAFFAAIASAIRAGLAGRLGPPPGARGAVDWAPR
jgi:rhamnosyltransferase